MVVAVIYFCAWGAAQPCGPDSALRTVRVPVQQAGSCALDAQVVAASGAWDPIMGRETVRLDCPTTHGGR